MIIFKLRDGTTEDVESNNVDMSCDGVYKAFFNHNLVRVFKDYEVISFSYKKEEPSNGK